MLTAINSILQSCGQAPVTTLDQTNPDVAIATQTLNEVSREVQAEGWSFNKESGVELALDIDNEFSINDNYIQIDLSNIPANVNRDVIRRNGKLYDKANHTYKFPDSTTLTCDVVRLVDLDDIPIPIKDFIVARAASVVSQRIIGDALQLQALQQRETYCRSLAMEYECNQGDYTYFGHSGATNAYQSYKPFHALYR